MDFSGNCCFISGSAELYIILTIHSRYVNTHEVFFLIFDTLLILLCVVTWIAFPPGKYLGERTAVPSPADSEEYYNLENQKV